MTEQFCQLLWIRNFSLIFSWPNAIHIALSHAGRCPGQRWVKLTFVQDSAESSWVLSRTQLSQAEFGQDTAELWTGQRWVKLSFVKDSAKLSWVLSGTALSQAESTRRCGLPKSQFQKRVRVIRLLLLFNSIPVWSTGWFEKVGRSSLDNSIWTTGKKVRQFSCAKEKCSIEFVHRASLQFGPFFNVSHLT